MSCRDSLRCPKGPAVLKVLRVVTLLLVVNLLGVVIRCRDDPRANAISPKKFSGIFPLREGFTAW